MNEKGRQFKINDDNDTNQRSISFKRPRLSYDLRTNNLLTFDFPQPLLRLGPSSIGFRASVPLFKSIDQAAPNHDVFTDIGIRAAPDQDAAAYWPVHEPMLMPKHAILLPTTTTFPRPKAKGGPLSNHTAARPSVHSDARARCHPRRFLFSGPRRPSHDA